MINAVSGRFKIRRVIIVCDRGMVSEKNIKQLELEGYEYVVGMRMRQLGKEDAGSFLSTQGMKSVTKGLRAREIDFKGKRLVVCFNKEQARRDKKKREEIIVRLLEKLKTQGLKSLLVHKEYSKYLKIKAVRITLKDMPVILRTELEENAHYAFKAVGLKIPPRLLSSLSDTQEKVVLRL